MLLVKRDARCVSIRRFSTLRSRVNIDIYATRVNLCTEKNSIINTDDESMINYSEVIVSRHKNTAHIHREPDLTRTHTVSAACSSTMIGPFVFGMLVSVLVRPADLSPVSGPEPIRCAPCSQEQLAACPAVSSDCPEVLREPGCGCCSSCALKKGDSCGVYTAHCGTGLRCVPRPGEPRPLHALTRGQAVCAESEEDTDVTSDQGALHYLLGLNRPLDPQDAAEAQESIKAKVNAIRKKLIQQGPCHTELHASLDVIAQSQQTLGEKFTSFYLPNCDKHGFYKAKQCETSLVGQPPRCWCVSSWSGKRIPGTDDLSEDSQCHQELTQ